MAKATAAAASETAPAAFKPKHPLVLVVSSKEAAQLTGKEISSTLAVLIALHASKTPFDLATPAECKKELSL